MTKRTKSIKKNGRGTRFNPARYFETAAKGRNISTHPRKQIIFAQGDAADAVFYIKKGKVKVTVVSTHGKEAVVALLGVDEFLGEGCLIGQPKRLATATAMTECVIMRVDKAEILRVLQDEPAFSQMFISHILARNARVEEDLVDQLFNSTEKRLARVLLLLANFGKEGRPGADHRQDQPGDAGRDDRHDALARQPFHEQVSSTGLHRLQRPSRGPQLVAERRPERSHSYGESTGGVTVPEGPGRIARMPRARRDERAPLAAGFAAQSHFCL